MLALRYAAKYDSYSLKMVVNGGLTQGLPRRRHELGIPFAALVFEMGIMSKNVADVIVDEASIH